MTDINEGNGEEQIREDALVGSLDGFGDQSDAADTVDGQTYEDMLDQGFSPADQPRDADSFDDEHQTIEDRIGEEVPDTDPESGYGPPAGEGAPDRPFEDDRAGRLVAPDEGAHEDRESDLVASDDGFAGGGASSEEAAVHYVDDEGGETEQLDETDLAEFDEADDISDEQIDQIDAGDEEATS